MKRINKGFIDVFEGRFTLEVSKEKFEELIKNPEIKGSITGLYQTIHFPGDGLVESTSYNQRPGELSYYEVTISHRYAQVISLYDRMNYG
jgi:hypothetical protein